MKRNYLIYLIITCTACAPLHQRATTHDDQNIIAPQANTAASFNLSGAIAAKNQHQGWTATFNWTQQDPNHYQILIYGPVGANAMEITKNNSNITYREGKKVLHSQNGETLLAKETGIRLPINHLYYWIRGKQAPGKVDAIVRSADKDIIALKQSGFHLSFSDYQNHHPHKIRLEGKNIVIKLVIKHWQYLPLG